MSSENLAESWTPLMDALPSHRDRASPEPDGGKKPTRRRYRRILFLVCALGSLLDFSTFMNMAPRTEILEQILCRGYYEKRGFGRALAPSASSFDCKAEAIQTELAMIQGWADAFGQLPGWWRWCRRWSCGTASGTDC